MPSSLVAHDGEVVRDVLQQTLERHAFRRVSAAAVGDAIIPIAPRRGRKVRNRIPMRSSLCSLGALTGLSFLVLVLSGCGAGPATQAPPSVPALRGMVHGGQQGVVGSTIQLYAAGAAGYGSAATALLNTPVTSLAGGSFNIDGDYTCPTPSTQVYITATGGNPGLAPGTNNPALSMMAALGNCGSLSSVPFIFINELTTVASVYAMAPFLATGGGTHLGASPGNAQGLANAFATVNNLVNVSTGTTPGPTLPVGATIPTDELNTLADILATCVNSNGTSGECESLFTAAKPVASGAPLNTLDAALDIALNPSNNVTDLFNLVTGTPPFQLTLITAPNDWTVDVNYVGGGLSTPFFLAIDATGNVWVSNNGNDSVTQLANNGNPISGPAGYTAGGVSGPWGIALDFAGNVWVADANSNALTELFPNGIPFDGSPFLVGTISNPFGIAINGAGTVWTANTGDVSAILNNGTAQDGSPYSGGGANDCYSIAIDGAGNTWITDHNSNSVTELDGSGAAISPPSGFSGGGITTPWGIAIDSSANVWVANNSVSSVSKLDSTGVVVSPLEGYIGGGLDLPQGLAVDGLGNVWVANNGSDSVTELANSGSAISPSTGYLGGGIIGPTSVAIDLSGNVWVSNGGGASVTEIVGAAAPVVTPLSIATDGALGVRP